MRLINDQGLPEEVIRAMRRGFRRPDTRPPNSISVTELLTPPQIRALERKHWNELRIDASELVWRLLGQATHAILEWGHVPVHEMDMSEEDQVEIVDGVEITGRLDLYEGQHRRITDYKVTSVYAVRNPDRLLEWESQLNLYAWFIRNLGRPVEAIRVVAILRDWHRSNAERDSEYPRVPMLSIPLPLWEQDEAERLLKRRLALHKRSWEGDIRPCTDRERWKERDRWQVWKSDGASRPSKSFTNEGEAIAWVKAHGGEYEVRFVPGTPLRCLYYCTVADFCPQWKAEQEGMGYGDQALGRDDR